MKLPLFFDFFVGVGVWDIQYLLPSEAPGSGNIFRVRRFRLGKPIAISPTGNVPLASSAPCQPKQQRRLLTFGCPQSLVGPCSPYPSSSLHIPASNLAMDLRLSITARNRIQQNPNAIAEHPRPPIETANAMRTAPKAPVNRWQSRCERLAR
ncbi:MAG TPA: hypothetical protein DDZ51_19000 [Planctomycetaceae bacterium]|nr:hypothetical protein [Planctomycetaceae bacterium]